MKYVADSMLGRLAKWLRVVGCDVTYFRDIDDDDLISYANDTKRVILTMDTLFRLACL